MKRFIAFFIGNIRVFFHSLHDRSIENVWLQEQAKLREMKKRLEREQAGYFSI
jgi:hypothetical protein